MWYYCHCTQHSCNSFFECRSCPYQIVASILLKQMFRRERKSEIDKSIEERKRGTVCSLKPIDLLLWQTEEREREREGGGGIWQQLEFSISLGAYKKIEVKRKMLPLGGEGGGGGGRRSLGAGKVNLHCQFQPSRSWNWNWRAESGWTASLDSTAWSRTPVHILGHAEHHFRNTRWARDLGACGMLPGSCSVSRKAAPPLSTPSSKYTANAMTCS